MTDEINTLLGGLGEPLARVKDKQKKDELRRVVESTAAPELRLRAALISGAKPADECLHAAVITRTLTFQDSWKFFSKLTTIERVVEAGPYFEAVRSLFKREAKVNLRAITARMIKISTLWDRNSKTPRPSKSSVKEFLRLAEEILKRRPSKQRHTSKQIQALTDLLVALLTSSCRLAMQFPTTDNLTACLRSLTAAERRQKLRLTSMRREHPTLNAQLSSVRSLAIRQLEIAAKKTEIDEFDNLFQALQDLPIDEVETQQIFEQLFSERARLDPAITKILTYAVGADDGPQLISVRTAAGSGWSPATVQLASVLLKAYSARTEGPHAQEAYEEIKSVFEDFYYLRLRDFVGEIQDYDPNLHEFGFDDSPSSRVEVIRPLVESLKPDEVGVVIKSLVRATIRR